MLGAKSFSESFQLLKKSQNLLSFLDSNERLHAITYNNLGCFYKTVQKPELALQMFEKSLEFKPHSLSHQAGTYLNISSIFSLTDSHEKALEYSTAAFDLLKSIYSSDSTVISSLLFAAFSTGKELEHLLKFSQAESMYLYASELAQQVPTSTLTEKISVSLSRLEKKKQFTQKPRYASTLRSSALPTIRANHSDIMKQYIIIDDKKMSTPRTARNYPPIIDLPFGKTTVNSASPTKKRGFSDIAQIKKELMEYENKLHKLTGKRTAKSRPAARKKQNKNPPGTFQLQKAVFNVKKKNKPDMIKAAIFIQKFWRGYKARKTCRQERRKIAHQRAREAIAELEILKEQAKIDELYMTEDTSRPKTYSPLKYHNHDKMYKTQGKFYTPSDYTAKEKKSVIKVQSFFKMWLQRNLYRTLREKAFLIQRNVKRYQCSKLFQKILSAILFIQYQWKKYIKGKRVMSRFN